MKAYSSDLRERMVRVAEEGRPREEIIHLFGVSRATTKRYIKQHQEPGIWLPSRFRAVRRPKEMPYERIYGAS